MNISFFKNLNIGEFVRIERELKKLGIIQYNINSDLTVDVYQNVVLNERLINKHIDIVFPATLYKEKYLHDKYDDSRMVDNREWFHKTKSLSNFIELHKKKNEIAMKWYYKQKEIKEIEKQIMSW